MKRGFKMNAKANVEFAWIPYCVYLLFSFKIIIEGRVKSKASLKYQLEELD